MKIRKLILPVAGLGKRLRPLTLHTPKNLVRLAGKPLIEYALDEAVQAGIEEVVVIISPAHREQYDTYLNKAKRNYAGIDFHIREQADPWGHGHALLQAEDLIGEDPVAVRFCDDVIVDAEPTLPRLLQVAEKMNSSTIFLERVPKEDVSRYGVVAADEVRPQISRIYGVVEKPSVDIAPSNLIIIGGYVLRPEIMMHLREMAGEMRKENDSLLITDALTREIERGGQLYGWEFPGVRLDCGTLEGLQYAENYMKEAGVEILVDRRS